MNYYLSKFCHKKGSLNTVIPQHQTPEVKVFQELQVAG